MTLAEAEKRLRAARLRYNEADDEYNAAWLKKEQAQNALDSAQQDLIAALKTTTPEGGK